MSHSTVAAFCDVLSGLLSLIRTKNWVTPTDTILIEYLAAVAKFAETAGEAPVSPHLIKSLGINVDMFTDDVDVTPIRNAAFSKVAGNRPLSFGDDAVFATGTFEPVDNSHVTLAFLLCQISVLFEKIHHSLCWPLARAAYVLQIVELDCWSGRLQSRFCLFSFCSWVRRCYAIVNLAMHDPAPGRSDVHGGMFGTVVDYEHDATTAAGACACVWLLRVCLLRVFSV